MKAGPGRIALIACWIGLLAGLIELTLRGVEKFALHRILYLSRDIVWMTPLADLILVFALTLPLMLLARRLPRLASVQAAVTKAGFFGAWSVLALQPWMAWWAMIMLALGIAIFAGRLAASHEERALAFIRRSTPLLAAVVVLLGVAERGGRFVAERRAIAGLPPAKAGTPNLLMIVWDAARPGDLSLYGYARRTSPRLDSLAARGVTFDRAIAPAPYTLPSHVSLFTGLWPHQNQSSWETPLEKGPPTLAEVLAGAGYRTAAFSANHILVTWEHGVLRGFSHDEDYTVSAGELARSSGLIKWLLTWDQVRRIIGWWDVPGRRDADDIGSSFLSWQASGDPSRPFFAFLNMYDAHDPYLPRAPYDTLFGWPGGGERERRAVRSLSLAYRGDMAPAELQRQHDQYDGGIAEMDHELGVILDELRRRGALANTIVIVASDHGEAFGEHRSFSHGSDVYPEEIDVPLVMVLPSRVPEGVRVHRVASLRDVPATALDLLAITHPVLPGRSLVRLWRDTADAANDTVLAEADRVPRGGKAWIAVRRGNVRSIIAWPWQLITTGTAEVELYDLSTDSNAHHSLDRSPAHAGTRDSLLAALRRWRRDAVPAKL